jgi:hypothetical protein
MVGWLEDWKIGIIISHLTYPGKDSSTFQPSSLPIFRPSILPPKQGAPKAPTHSRRSLADPHLPAQRGRPIA